MSSMSASTSYTLSESCELNRLRSENQQLQDELTQCKGDKEFVWSLWKRLQVANPDMTAAISVVLQREKQKMDVREKEVTELLTTKEERIRELERTTAHQTDIINELLARKLELTSVVESLRSDLSITHKHITSLGQQVVDLERRNAETASREAVRELDAKNLELKRQLNAASAELDTKSSELERVREKNAELTTTVDNQRKRLHCLEEVNRSLESSDTTMKQDHSRVRERLKKSEEKLQSVVEELDRKNIELDSARKESKELSLMCQTHRQTSSQQSDLIGQLQALHQDTQSVLRSQEEAYAMELASLQRSLREQYDLIGEQREKIDRLSESERTAQDDDKLLKMELEAADARIETLESELRLLGEGVSTEVAITSGPESRLSRHISPASGSHASRRGSPRTELHVTHRARPGTSVLLSRGSSQRSVSQITHGTSPVPAVASYRGRQRGRSQGNSSALQNLFPPARRSKTLSRSPENATGRRRGEVYGSEGRGEGFGRVDGDDEGWMGGAGVVKLLRDRLNETERKLDELRHLLSMKNVELEALRTSHGRRLERLRSLQMSYQLIKKQNHLYQHEQQKQSTCASVINLLKPAPPARPDIKALQQENADEVWNELAHLRKENKKLNADNLRLVDEADLALVQSASTATTIQDLKYSLLQQKDDFNSALDKSEQRLVAEKQKTESAKSQCETIRNMLSLVKSEMKELDADRENLIAEKRYLMEESQTLRELVHENKKTFNGQHKELLRCRRRLRRLALISSSRTTTPALPTTTVGAHMIGPTPSLYRSRGVGRRGAAGKRGRVLQHLMDTPLSAEEGGSKRNGVEDMGRAGNKMKGGESDQDWLDSEEEMIQDEQVSLSDRQTSGEITAPRDGGCCEDLREEEEVRDFGQRGQIGEVRNSDNYQGPQGAKVSRDTGRIKMNLTREQMIILKASRDAALRSSDQVKLDCDSLNSRLLSANQKLAANKQQLQRLTNEVDRLRSEKNTLETKMADYTFDDSATACCGGGGGIGGGGGGEGGRGGSGGATEQELANLAARLKASTTALSKQLELSKQLKNDNDRLTEKITQLSERVDHLDRDLSQKRTLVEDYKLKLSLAQENAESDSDVMLEVEAKLKSLNEHNVRLKAEIERLKTRISTITREKQETQVSVRQLSAQLDKKSKLATDAQKKVSELTVSLAEMERSADSHLHRLAAQTESAIGTAHERLTRTEERINHYTLFVQALARALLDKIRQARTEVAAHRGRQQQEQEQKNKNKIISRAVSRPSRGDVTADVGPSVKRLACDILDISQSDFDDIMSVTSQRDEVEENEGVRGGVGDDGGGQVGGGGNTERSLDVSAPAEGGLQRGDAQWAKNCERLLKSTDDFSVKLVDLFLQKIEEHCSLIQQL